MRRIHSRTPLLSGARKALAAFGAACLALLMAQPADAQGRWVFNLTQGKKLSVCQAYLKRLNVGAQANLPFCDRPETGAEYGFPVLNRGPISPEEAHASAPRIQGFISSMNQDANEIVNAQRAMLKLEPVDWLPLKDAVRYLGRDIKVWRYEPPIDIDNDGQPDAIVIWHGYPAGGFGCGSTDKRGNPVGVMQVPFFVDPQASRIDVLKTFTVFGHPSRGYRIHEGTKKETYAKNFRPVGTSIGIFKYEGVYYFDTFFDSWGDFRGARRTDPRIQDLLAVFVRRNEKTQQVCEFLWDNRPKIQGLPLLKSKPRNDSQK